MFSLLETHIVFLVLLFVNDVADRLLGRRLKRHRALCTPQAGYADVCQP
jgi:hypothetical protein